MGKVRAGARSEQVDAIRGRSAQIPGIPRDTQRKRRAEINEIRAEAKQAARYLIEDPFWSAGVALCKGEGFKQAGQLGMANADPDALRFFVRWACDYHELTHGFRAKINLHADNNELSAREWWARELSMPLSDFTKTYIKPDGTGHRKNHLAHGVCLVRARKSADAFHRTLAWVEFMQDTLGS